MMRRRAMAWSLLAGACVAFVTAACSLQKGEQKPRLTLFVGVDASGSFYNSGDYDDALSFLAHYIYGHINGLGGLDRPRELFVASIGGSSQGEPKAFHPYLDFTGKSVPQIEDSLREWFPPVDKLTDFNAFFQQVARIVKERNLVLSPVSIMVVSDGVPDLTPGMAKAETTDLYDAIDLTSLEYLARSVTLRMTYVSPKVGERWRSLVPRQRIRLWTVDAEIMRGWNTQIVPVANLEAQNRLWGWIRDNVDFRVRSAGI